MDATESALLLLDYLERNDLTALQSCVQDLRKARVELKRDGFELVERAVVLDRPEALRALLQLGANDHCGVLFGVYAHDFGRRLADDCLKSGRLRLLLELLADGTRLPQLSTDDTLVERVAAAAISEFNLDDATVVKIAKACEANRGAFLVQALRCGRLPLVRCLVGLFGAKSWYGAYRLGDVPLVVAAEVGATSVLRLLVEAGSLPNVGLRGTGGALHIAVGCDRLTASARAELVHELLRLGAVPELRGPNGMDAYALATARNDVEVISLLREHGRAYGPRQSREARKKGVRDLCLLYDRADGLIYRVGQPDVPFLEGGDHDGCMPCSIESFRAAFDRVRRNRREIPLDWFEPFLDRLEHGQDFGYAELIARAPGIRLVGFDQTSNWSQGMD